MGDASASDSGGSPASAAWTAVIVNYNAGSHLLACVESVVADRSAGSVEVVVVDNASDDGSLEPLAALPIRVVHSGGNLGLAAAANLGIAVASTAVVAVLNPDLVVHPGCARAMVESLTAAADIGAVGPRINNPDGSIYPSARREPSLADAIGHGLLGAIAPRNPFTRRYRELDVEATTTRDADWLSGAAIWFRRSALDQVGGWDERYFMFMEDVDISRRLRASGWRLVYVPGGTVNHEEGVSRRRHPYRMIVAHHRSVYRYAQRWWRGPRRLLLPFVAAGLVVRAALTVAARRGGSGLRRRRPQVRG